MGLELVTAPQSEPIDLATAKAHMHVDSNDDDTLITALIAAARERVEGFTQRALITQTWKLVLDMPNNKVRIPKPPLQKVSSIEVIDTDGSASTIDPKDYIVDTSGIYGRVTPTKASRLAFVDPELWRGIWPWHRGFASFIVTFDAGYGDTADAVPEALRTAILMLTAQMYENREGQPSDTKSTLARTMNVSIGADLPPMVRDLCMPYRAMVI